MKLVFNANGVLTSNPTENITTGAINGADPATFSLSFLNARQQNTGCLLYTSPANDARRVFD